MVLENKKRIVLYGAGGFGREVALILSGLKDKYELIGFVDDGLQYEKGIDIAGVPFLGGREWVLEHKDEDLYFNCCIGNPAVKSRIQEELTKMGLRFESIIAKNVFIPNSSVIGPGCVIYSNVGISVDCKIGAGVLLNDGVTVGHDAEIGDYTTIMPGTGISGACKIGSNVRIGGHAFIIPGKKVGDFSTIAAGSVVFSNVKEGTTVLGNPAKRMRVLE